MIPTREPIARRDEILSAATLSKAELDGAIASVLARIDAALPVFTEAFPEPSSVDGTYSAMDNTEWTNGFWTGILWLAYEVSGESRYRNAAEIQVASFAERIQKEISVDHHDLGFLYSLSCVSAYKITGSPQARNAALKAAEKLLTRFLPVAGIIQAWGDLSDPEQAGRMIIDCNLNLPLLYWASEESGDREFADAADRHIAQAQKYIVRSDGSTFHTYYMDPKTGAPRHGSTHQGFSDTSCWARGQAWGIAGFPLVYRYKRDASLISLSATLSNYYLNRLPDDFVACWDLVFTDAPRDSSASAIAVCGFLELIKSLPQTDPDRAAYEAAACVTMQNLIKNYACSPGEPGNGLLKHGVYHMPKGIGVDESNLWGDYFYLEALIRLTRIWESYW